MFVASLAIHGLLGLANAQFPPKPEGVKILKSKFHENVTISYKEPGICETTPGVKSYSGYVHLPPGFIDGEAQEYPINTFFWFFEARKDPANAPLAIWLNGGPGSSSMMGLLEENGPCLISADSKTTILNPWSWNNEVNMLYIDQPTQVGFSYDVPTNATMVISDEGDDFWRTPTNFTNDSPKANYTHRIGTFSSQDPSHTVNTTEKAAHALWHFAQTWFFEFPYYKPANDRISLWTESYGGHYGPATARLFQEQNEKIANGSSEEKNAQYIHLDTLGIINGLLDVVVQGEAYISFPYNNTYGIQVFNQTTYEMLMDQWTRPGGTKESIIKCREAMEERDFSSVHADILPAACDISESGEEATEYYQIKVDDPRGWYDIGHPKFDPFPEPGLYGYLSQESVLAALGVPVNYTESSRAVQDGFVQALDIAKGGFIESVGYLLDNGVNVHMMYGDRDYACNWVGGERASLAVPYSRTAEFVDTGYSPLLTLDGWSGMTRQVGNYSFTRVFQAGHEIPSYQPIAAYEIFMRATFGRDIPTGLVSVTDDYSTIGPKDTWHIKSIPPKMPKPRCYVLKPGSCPTEVWKTVVNGTAVVKDWFVVDEDEEDVVTGNFGTSSEPWKDQSVIGEL